MKRLWLIPFLVACFTLHRPTAEAASPDPIPLPNAHSHNDYEHARPLWDALDHGFCSVEADIYLVDGQLLVAHDRNKVDVRKTLQSLYLDPLRQRVKDNGGRVFKNGPFCMLLIDVKSDADATYRALSKVLAGYEDVLTCFTDGQTRTNAITVVISGNRAATLMAADKIRYAGYDGRLSDLDTKIDCHFMPLISHNWQLVFTWRGTGPMPATEHTKLWQIVEKAHQQGCRVRFWGTPDKPPVWQELLAARVDLINADDLDGLRMFLLDQRH